MSWKCVICDSYNEESARQCYVCGQLRSAESIREGKIREREERIARINSAVYKNAYGISKAFFVSGLAASLVIIVISVTLKVANGQLDDIWQSANVVASRFGYNLRYAFGKNSTLLFARILSGSLKDLAVNTQVICLILGNNIAAFHDVAVEIIPMAAKKNITRSYSNAVVQISHNISSNSAMLGAVFSELFSSIAESISCLINVAADMFSRAIKHFS